MERTNSYSWLWWWSQESTCDKMTGNSVYSLCQCQCPSFINALELCNMQTLRASERWVQRLTLYYLSNFLWIYNYFKISRKRSYERTSLYWYLWVTNCFFRKTQQKQNFWCKGSTYICGLINCSSEKLPNYTCWHQCLTSLISTQLPKVDTHTHIHLSPLDMQ